MPMSWSDRASVLMAAAFNFSLAFIFLNALLDPAHNTGFIFNLGLLIFIIEFLSIHSAGMLGLKRPGPPSRMLHALIHDFPVVLFYMIFIAMLGLIFGNWQLLLLFAASLFGKLLVPADDREKMGIQVALLFVFLILAVALAPLLAAIFPFSAEVLAQKQPDSSGVFVDTPQALLVWGTLYYGVLALLDILKTIKGILKG